LSGQDFEDVALASCDVCCMLKSTHVLLKVYGKTISVLKTLSAEKIFHVLKYDENVSVLSSA